MRHYANPMFLLTDDDYNARGAVAVDNGRLIGHDTAGAQLFDRKDWRGAEAAAKKLGFRFVTSSYYGVEPGGPRDPFRQGDPAPEVMPHLSMFTITAAGGRPPKRTVHGRSDCPEVKGGYHSKIRTSVGRAVLQAQAAGERRSEGLDLCGTCLPAPEPASESEPVDPSGSYDDLHGNPEPAEPWAYEVDDYNLVYGGGTWPFFRDGKPGSVRLSPDTKFWAWGSLYASAWPDHPGHAAGSINCTVRKPGPGSVVVFCPVRFDIDLLTDTFTLPDTCPPELREQAAAKAQKVVDVIVAARTDREHHVRPWTAHDRHLFQQGEMAPRELRTTPFAPEPSAVAAEVNALRQNDWVWQRVGPDEWLSAHPASGGDGRPCTHRHDIATVLMFGPVEPIDCQPADELDRQAAHLVGTTVIVQGHRELRVDSVQHGFIAGRTHHHYQVPVVMHLTDAGLPLGEPDPWGDVLDELLTP